MFRIHVIILMACTFLRRETQARILWFEVPCCFCVSRSLCSNNFLSAEGLRQFDYEANNIYATISIYDLVNTKSCPNLSDSCCSIPGASNLDQCQKGAHDSKIHTRIGSSDPFPALPSSPDTSSRTTTTTLSPIPPPSNHNINFPISLPDEIGSPDTNTEKDDRSDGKNIPKPSPYLANPWLALLLENVQIGSKTFQLYVSSASLIRPDVILTSAKSVSGKNLQNLLVRVGEWDPNTESEAHPHQDVQIKRILMHPSFVESPTAFDVALVFLKDKVTQGPNVQVIKLAKRRRDFDQNNCVALKWQKSTFTLTSYKTSILRKRFCRKKVKTTSAFNLHNSFTCARAAGTHHDKDCEIDKGSPLICRGPTLSPEFVQVGIASWEVDCGDPSLPVLYSNVMTLQRWIKNNAGDEGGQALAFPARIGNRPAQGQEGNLNPKVNRKRNRKGRRKGRRFTKAERMKLRRKGKNGKNREENNFRKRLSKAERKLKKKARRQERRKANVSNYY